MELSKIRIRNFTVFKDMKAEFSKGVNVIIGENGTGKTHLLKLLFAYANNKEITLQDVFCNKGDEFQFNENSNDTSRNIEIDNIQMNCIYIPVADMLAHSKGFTSMYQEYNMPFDITYNNILVKAQLPNKRKDKYENLLNKLSGVFSGDVIYENDAFYIKKNTGEKINANMEADGFKKFAILYQLIKNGSLSENTALFWDEPESNINPKNIPVLIEILLELQRNGVQIFITTHDYIFAKYFEVKRDDSDQVMFHSLHKTDEGVQCESKIYFKELENNPIMDTFIQLYKDEIEKVISDES